MAQSCHIRQSA